MLVHGAHAAVTVTYRSDELELEVTAVAEIAHWNFNPGGITKTLMDDYTAEVKPKAAAA